MVCSGIARQIQIMAFYQMNKQKDIWEELAKENSRYYINSDFGRSINEEQFRKSGYNSYQKLIASDPLLAGRRSILDFGCGTGRLTEFMVKDFEKVVGVDISPTMIAQANTRLKGLNNVELLETGGRTIPLPDGSIDIVFAYLVFQHIKKGDMVEALFEEIFRVLAPKGIFKVLLRSDKQKDMTRWWSGVQYSPESIKKVYGKIDFELLKIEYVDKHAYWLWMKKR